MNNLSEKVSYIKGLAEGLGIKDNTKEEKVLKSIIDVLDDMAKSIEMLDTLNSELSDYVEAIDDDLALVEEDLYDEEDEDEEAEDGFVEVECPNCHDTVYLDEELFEDDEEITCPNCHEPIYFECECCHGECDCEDKE